MHAPAGNESVSRRDVRRQGTSEDCHPEPVRFAQGRLREGSQLPAEKQILRALRALRMTICQTLPKGHTYVEDNGSGRDVGGVAPRGFR